MKGRSEKVIENKVSVSGGKKAAEIFRKARLGSEATAVEVGFFATAKYPDGLPVATVAAWNEFGTRRKSGRVGTPSRPFMRNAIANAEDGIVDIARRHIDPVDMKINRGTAQLIGAYVQGEIQREIVNLRKPGNADITKERKGKDNPLIDTGTMRTAVTFKVNT